MTKLYEVKTPQEWTNLLDLVAGELPETIELFNAGREGGVDILYTESSTVPVSGALFKLLKRQKAIALIIGTQPIWVKSELQKANLIISTPQGVAGVCSKLNAAIGDTQTALTEILGA